MLAVISQGFDIDVLRRWFYGYIYEYSYRYALILGVWKQSRGYSMNMLE